MADWGPVVIGVVLFVLLQPGLLFQLPGNGRQIEFGSMKTNGKAIAVHTLIFFTIYAILILAVHVHIYTGVWGKDGCKPYLYSNWDRIGIERLLRKSSRLKVIV
ncbi:hypothetical protein R6Q57_013986 [Mikania cordata]